MALSVLFFYNRYESVTLQAKLIQNTLWNLKYTGAELLKILHPDLGSCHLKVHFVGREFRRGEKPVSKPLEKGWHPQNYFGFGLGGGGDGGL